MATPLNTVDDFKRWSAFRQGVPIGLESVDNGTFSIEQINDALLDASEEILDLLGGIEPTSLPQYRQDRLKRAERYLAVAVLCELHAEKTAINVAQADIANLGSVSRGADVPSREEKQKHWLAVAQQYRERAYRLVRGGSIFYFRRFSSGYDHDLFPYETNYGRGHHGRM